MEEEHNIEANQLNGRKNRSFFILSLIDFNIISSGRSKKRRRNPHLHKVSIAKDKVEKAKARVLKSGKAIRAKAFQYQANCKCKRKCAEKIDIVRQNEIYNVYYNESLWMQKTMFIRSSVTTSAPIKKRSEWLPIIPLKEKKNIFAYRLIDSEGISQEVCRDFFMKCIQVGQSRIRRAMISVRENPNCTEMRGSRPSKNKTKPEDHAAVVTFIKSIPTYESHYGRAQTERRYLRPGLNMMKLYTEYKNVMEFRGLNTVSHHIFRRIFHTEFNLSFKKRQTDTCSTCDHFRATMESQIVQPSIKNSIEKQKRDHIHLVQQTKKEFDNDVKRAADSDGEIVVLTFDLQKALESPSLSTSVAYYKRQLWTFNLGIYNEVERKGLHIYLANSVCIHTYICTNENRHIFHENLYILLYIYFH